jgi:hypothetical protein
MSDHETERPLVEQRSTVKISQTAKGDPQVEVKVVADQGETVEHAAQRAVDVWRSTVDAAREAVAA